MLHALCSMPEQSTCNSPVREKHFLYLLDREWQMCVGHIYVQKPVTIL